MKATLSSGGQLVLSHAEISLENIDDASTGLTNWRGTILLSQGEHLEPGLYRLKLEDGRSAEIIINYTPSQPGPMTIYFQGSGELK